MKPAVDGFFKEMFAALQLRPEAEDGQDSGEGAVDDTAGMAE